MYVDTSCLVAFFIPEIHTEKANSVILEAQELHISSLTKVEFISALNKKLRMGTIDSGDAELSSSEFERQINERIFIKHHFEVQHFRRAEIMLKQTTLPLLSLDSLHLSICFLQRQPLFTFDEVLAKAAKEFGIEVIPYSG